MQDSFKVLCQSQVDARARGSMILNMPNLSKMWQSVTWVTCPYWHQGSSRRKALHWNQVFPDVSSNILEHWKWSTIMPEYSVRCCSNVFSKQPSHAGAKKSWRLNLENVSHHSKFFSLFLQRLKCWFWWQLHRKKRRPMRKFCILVAFWVGVCIQHQRGCVKMTPFRPVVTFPPFTDIHCV